MSAAPDAAASLMRGFFRLHPDEAAEELEVATPEDASAILAGVDPVEAARVLERLSPEAAANVFEHLAPGQAAKVAVHMDAARAASLAARLDDEGREALFAELGARTTRELRELLTYPPDRAGAHMDPRVHTFRPEVRVSDAIVRLRRAGKRWLHDVFVVDDGGRLIGVVPVHVLLVAAPDARLDTIWQTAPASVPATAGGEEVAELLDIHPLVSLPVVDVEGRLLGVIRHRALMEAVESDATADIQSMVGAGKEERALSSIPFAVRKRLPWLQINLATAFLAASIVGLFESTIASYTALAVLLPVVAGQSGNTGSQALAVTLRGLALREIRLSQWFRVCVKEAGVGAVNGVAVAVVTALGVYVWSGSAGLMLVIGLAMVISMSIAGVTGAAIPIILSAIGQDPAQSSSIILTTVTDVSGFFSFLGLATVFSSAL